MLVRYAIALALAASPAAAFDDFGNLSAPSRMSLKPGEGPCFAVVEIVNSAGVYNRADTLETEHGPVVLHYATVGGHRPGDDDVVTVVSLPPDVLAEPPELEIPDGETGSICLIRWQGARTRAFSSTPIPGCGGGGGGCAWGSSRIVKKTLKAAGRVRLDVDV